MFRTLIQRRFRELSGANWKGVFLRALGFGVGFALGAGVFLGAAFWWSERPKAWSSKLISGKPVDIFFVDQEDSLVVRFRYAITNNTNSDYELPSETMGALMGVLANGGSLSKLQGATWNSDLRIPPQQSVAMNFESTFKYSDYNTSKAELNASAKSPEALKELTPEFKTFIERRLKEYDGLVFLDYADRYKIVLPSDWKDIHH